MGRLTLAFIADVLSHEREQKQAKEAAKAEKKTDESAKEGKPVPSATVGSAQTCCILRRLCHQENLSTLASKASISACELFEVGALFNFIVVFFYHVCMCVRSCARVPLCVLPPGDFSCSARRPIYFENFCFWGQIFLYPKVS